MSDWDDEERLGYKRPPKWAQYKKGQSGNPKGRPRKRKHTPNVASPSNDSELDRIQREALDQVLTVSEGGVKKKRKASEVVTKAQINNAIKGQPMAQRDVLKNARELEQREARREAERQEKEQQDKLEKARDELLAFEYYAALKESQAKAWAQAEAEGRDEPDFPWPHPDDILLDQGRKKYRLVGPMEASAVPLYQFQRAERDAALLRMMIALKAKGADGQALAEFWACIFGMYDAQMPKRWKVGDDFQLMCERHDRRGLCELEEMLSDAERRSARWKRLSGCDKDCKEAYRVANEVMKPILKRQGYKSLAQFERAYEDSDGAPPWLSC